MGVSVDPGHTALTRMPSGPSCNAADRVRPRIADFVAGYRDSYDLIVTTQDWHIDPGAHFAAAPDFVDTWPGHGVAGTPEADLHPALAGINPDVQIKKGEHAAAYQDAHERLTRELESAQSRIAGAGGTS